MGGKSTFIRQVSFALMVNFFMNHSRNLFICILSKDMEVAISYQKKRKKSSLKPNNLLKCHGFMYRKDDLSGTICITSLY